MSQHALCNPPPGHFDADFEGLSWCDSDFKGKSFKSAFIPRDRVPDFVSGEQKRGHCLFIGKARNIKEDEAKVCFSHCFCR